MLSVLIPLLNLYRKQQETIWSSSHTFITYGTVMQSCCCILEEESVQLLKHNYAYRICNLLPVYGIIPEVNSQSSAQPWTALGPAINKHL